MPPRPPPGSSWPAVSLLPAIPEGALDGATCADETGSEEDLYEDLHSSGHHYGHSGGGGEQLAINEVGSGLVGREGLGGWPGHHGDCSTGSVLLAGDSGTGGHTAWFQPVALT